MQKARSAVTRSRGGERKGSEGSADTPASPCGGSRGPGHGRTEAAAAEAWALLSWWSQSTCMHLRAHTRLCTRVHVHTCPFLNSPFAQHCESHSYSCMASESTRRRCRPNDSGAKLPTSYWGLAADAGSSASLRQTRSLPRRANISAPESRERKTTTLVMIPSTKLLPGRIMQPWEDAVLGSPTAVIIQANVQLVLLQAAIRHGSNRGPVWQDAAAVILASPAPAAAWRLHGRPGICS